jgi:hypothetical protein
MEKLKNVKGKGVDNAFVSHYQLIVKIIYLR